MRTQLFSPTVCSPKISSAWGTSLLATSSAKVVLQSSNGDTFTPAVSKAENRSGLNAISDVAGVKDVVVTLLERLGEDYNVFGLVKEEIGFDALDFASKSSGFVDFCLARSHDGNELRLKDLRGKEPETLISFVMQSSRANKAGGQIQVKTIQNGRGAQVQIQELSPNSGSLTPALWKHPHLNPDAKLKKFEVSHILLILSQDEQFQPAEHEDIFSLFEQCQVLVDQLFNDNKQFLYEQS